VLRSVLVAAVVVALVTQAATAGAAAGQPADVGVAGPTGPAPELTADRGRDATAGNRATATASNRTTATASNRTTATAADDADENDTVHEVTVTPLGDVDVDGAAAAFEVTVRADTTMDDTDVPGNNPGEPYVEIEVDGDDVAELKDLPRSESFETTVTLTAADLADVEPGSHELTVELWDKDGGSYDATDLGNDDKLDERTVPITVERQAEFDLEAGRTNATVGSVVALRALGEFDGDVNWTLAAAPAGSEAAIDTRPNGPTAAVRVDAAGEYVVRAASPTGNRTATVTLTAGDASTHRLLRAYAPRLHYHAEERYRPTRYEAFVANATLEDLRSLDVEDPTMFDLAGRGSRWELELVGDQPDFRRYDDPYPPTVYGSVHRDVEFRGETYTALTYWLFYIYDPKDDDDVTALLAHQSDLETVTVLLRDGEPEWVGASQHFGGELRRWETVERTGSHLHVYPALGAHSNYLRNTEQVEGGIPIQRQFVNQSSTETALVDAPFVDYVDRTGDDTVFAHDGSGDARYQVVPLTGRAVWASYRGAFGPADDEGNVPTARTRWKQPGPWMERSLAPAHEQVDGRLAVQEARVEDGTLALTARVANEGPKPDVFRVVVEGTPADADWNGSATTTLAEVPVPLGVGRNTTVTAEAPLPEGADGWRFRARLAALPDPSPAAALDVARLGARATATPSASPTGTDGATPTPSGTDEDQLPVPGFGPAAALAALVALAALLARRRLGRP